MTEPRSSSFESVVDAFERQSKNDAEKLRVYEDTLRWIASVELSDWSNRSVQRAFVQSKHAARRALDRFSVDLLLITTVEGDSTPDGAHPGGQTAGASVRATPSRLKQVLTLPLGVPYGFVVGGTHAFVSEFWRAYRTQRRRSS